MRALFLLPAIALMVAAPTIPLLTHQSVMAAPGGMRGMKFQQLNLTEDQRTRIQQIKEAARQQMESILTPEQRTQLQQARQQRQRPNLNLTESQQASMRALRQNTKSQMEAVLTAEQRQKLQELRQQRTQRRQPQAPPQN